MNKKARKAKMSPNPIGKRAKVPKGNTEKTIPKLQNTMAKIKNSFLITLEFNYQMQWIK